LKIAFLSDAPMLGTGFGQEARYLSTALAADGHSVYVYTCR